MPVSRKRKNRKRRPVQVPTQVLGARARRQAAIHWSPEALAATQRARGKGTIA